VLKTGNLIISTVILVSLFLVACGSGGDGSIPTPTARLTPTPRSTTTAVSTISSPVVTPRPDTPSTTPEPTTTAVIEITEDILEDGKKLYTSGPFPCVACHKIEGIKEAVGVLGPEHTHLATVAATRRDGYTAEQYIRESLEKPDDFIVKGFASALMPKDLSDLFTDKEFEALMAFLLTLE